MYGIVGFQDLKVNCIIGIHPEERHVEQCLLVSIETEWDFSKVVAKDDLTQAVDYAKLADYSSEFIKRRKYHMLETLGFELVRELRTNFDLSWIKLTVKKPKALTDAVCSFIELQDGVRQSCGR